jgi:hypothetical protein
MLVVLKQLIRVSNRIKFMDEKSMGDVLLCKILVLVIIISMAIRRLRAKRGCLSWSSL